MLPEGRINVNITTGMHRAVISGSGNIMGPSSELRVCVCDTFHKSEGIQNSYSLDYDLKSGERLDWREMRGHIMKYRINKVIM